MICTEKMAPLDVFGESESFLFFCRLNYEVPNTSWWLPSVMIVANPSVMQLMSSRDMDDLGKLNLFTLGICKIDLPNRKSFGSNQTNRLDPVPRSVGPIPSS